MADEVLLELQNISMGFGSKLILRDVSVKVNKITTRPHGKVICFLGPSGMGKTILCRIIAGFQKPTTGRVLLRTCETAPGKVCVVPQNYPMFEYATVKANLEIAATNTGYDARTIQTNVAELVETFGLAEHLAKYPRELSGGTRQRVAIARQLMCPSNYIVMDEPFSGLDPISKASAMGAITALAARDVYNTIILVTHDVTSGLVVADTVWMLGLERSEDGSCVAGARLVTTYDLAELGFAWREDIEQDPAFLVFAREVKNRFNTLGGKVGR